MPVDLDPNSEFHKAMRELSRMDRENGFLDDELEGRVITKKDIREAREAFPELFEDENDPIYYVCILLGIGRFREVDYGHTLELAMERLAVIQQADAQAGNTFSYAILKLIYHDYAPDFNENYNLEI